MESVFFFRIHYQIAIDFDYSKANNVNYVMEVIDVILLFLTFDGCQIVYWTELIRNVF